MFAGKIGPFPGPVWAALVGRLSSHDGRPGVAGRATVLELRLACKALLGLVGRCCVGGAGTQRMRTAAAAAQLETASTAGLGRALVVSASLSDSQSESLHLVVVAALVAAVSRGHMVWLVAPPGGCTSAVARAAEAMLIDASRRDQLVHAFFYRSVSKVWRDDALAQLTSVGLDGPVQPTIAAILSTGTPQRIEICKAVSFDLSVVSTLRDVTLDSCSCVVDLAPLADVPRLVVWWCHSLRVLPAMRNAWLEVDWCSLIDVSGLAGGRVGHLELRDQPKLGDVSAIGAMQPPPRTLILSQMPEVRDISMLAGIHQLTVSNCRELDKAATLAALEGRVGSIKWNP